MNTDNNDFYDDDLSRSLINNDFEDNSPRRKKKSKKPLIICLVISFTMIAMGIDNTNAITITLSCVGNVGPTLGTEIGPTMSWSELPDVAKWFCSLMMLIGRLEIFSVLVIFTPAFWREN